MIKTQTKEESRFVRAILPAYVDHVFRNPNSLLVRFYGMHRLVYSVYVCCEISIYTLRYISLQ